MAAAFFNALADPEKARAVAAGTEPAEHVHPEVASAMAELGFDLSRAKPQKLTAELAHDASLMITMGCGEDCPHLPGLPVEDWALEDPKGKPVEQVRQIRDAIGSRVRRLLVREGLSGEK